MMHLLWIYNLSTNVKSTVWLVVTLRLLSIDEARRPAAP